MTMEAVSLSDPLGQVLQSYISAGVGNEQCERNRYRQGDGQEPGKHRNFRYVPIFGSRIHGCIQKPEASMDILRHLIKALKDTDKSVVKKAIDILWEIGDPRSAKPLVGLLKNSDDEIRQQATLALAYIQDLGSAKTLVGLLNNPNESIRYAVVYILGEIGDSQSVKPLIKRLNDQAPIVVDMAIGGLNQIDSAWKTLPEANAMIPKCINSATGILKDINSDDDDREHAEMTLSGLNDPRIVKPVLPLLKDPNPEVRCSAVRVLGSVKMSNLTKHLIAMLKDTDPTVRAETVAVLGDLYKQ